MQNIDASNMKYYRLLAKQYPDRKQALGEAVLSEGALLLPKPTEHFVSDLHGEFRPFAHVIRNASGVLRRYIDELFPQKSEEEKRRLATILYYPKAKLRALEGEMERSAYEALLLETLGDMILVAKRVAAKYDHRKIARAFRPNRAEVLDILLLEEPSFRHKEQYVHRVYEYIVRTGEAEGYIRALADLCVHFAIETLHVIGDIYDRGEGAEKIVDTLMHHPNVDIQWGNHDIAWIGAAAGNFPLLANVVRIALRYNVLSTLEDGYGINLLPLFNYAKQYAPTAPFYPRNPAPEAERNETIARLHKAISVLQFKAEGRLIRRHPEYEMDDMLHLHRMDLKKKTVTVGDVTYPLRDDDFPTVDPADPYAFTREEEEVVERLRASFMGSEKLKRHIRFIVDRGGMYKICNGNLLFHGCIPLDEAGNFRMTRFMGRPLAGKALLDALDDAVRIGVFGHGAAQQEAADLMLYLWCGTDSPLFGKNRITTFERYFIEDPETHYEKKNPYFRLREDADTAEKILHAFGLDDPRAKIINGHTPVKRAKGEHPVKANGKVIVIDGGFARAYQKTTGTSGYTLISNSYGILLAAHAPLANEADLIEENVDITSSMEFVLEYDERRLLEDSDAGDALKEKIRDLYTLAELYRTGKLRERR